MATTLTTIALTKLLAPVINQLYAGASGKAKDALKRLATNAGIKKAASSLLKVDKVKTIWSPEQEVSLAKFYYPSHLSTKAYISSDYDFTPGEATELPDHGNVVIEGIVGQGKSIYMRHLASTMLSQENLERIPAFLELRTITAKRSLSDAISGLLGSWGLSSPVEAFEYLASSGKIVLLLDGFDEIPAECITDTVFEIDLLQTRYPELRIIVSSRPRHHIQNVTSFKVLELVRLSQEDYDPFVAKLINSPVKRFDVVEALHNCSSGIQGVISTPLMLTLVVIVYQTEKEIPTTLSDFFEKLFGTVFSKHDRLKAGFNRQHHTKLSERKLKQLFDVFCFMLIQLGGGRSVSSRLFESAFDSATRYAPECKCEIEDFRTDIVKVACLMQDEGIDTTTFLHKSILEYHASAFVKSLSDERAVQFYNLAFKTFNRWAPVLRFLKTTDAPRYNKFYVIEHNTPLVEEAREVLRSRDPKKLAPFLEMHIPGMFFAFDDDCDVVEFGSSVLVEPEFSQDLSAEVSHAIIGYLKESASQKVIRPALKRTHDFPTERPTLSLATYFKKFSLEPIWEAVAVIHLQYAGTIREAELDVKFESDKGDFLLDILGKKVPHISFE